MINCCLQLAQVAKNLFHYSGWNLSREHHYVRNVLRWVRLILKHLHLILALHQSLQLVHAAKVQLKCAKTGLTKAGLLAVLHIQNVDGQKIIANKLNTVRRAD